MYVKKVPDTFETIAEMGAMNNALEAAGDRPELEQGGRGTRPARRGREQDTFRSLTDCIAHLKTPKGSKPVLKTMMTTACERNCHYCPFRAGHSGTKRLTITPDNLAKAFDMMQRKGTVDGLFLSSGIIKGGATTQDKIIDTAEIIRQRYQYRGYIHLKIMPGAEYDQLHRAMQLADRVSINLEGPTEQRLNALAPKKDLHNELLIQLQRAHQIRQQNPHIRASVVTQFVVGAVGDTDVELLSLSHRLYHQLNLARTYYSAFHPISGTPFEDLPAEDPQRQHRLYQASFLLRDYGWDVEDLPFIGVGNLRKDVDPKIAWADVHLRENPVDLMTAERDQLLRVPGIGMKGANAILRARRQRRLHDAGQLRRLGIRAPEAMAPYVLLGGKALPHQPRLL